MTATMDLVERSGELKAELIEFSRQPRYEQAFGEVASAHRVEGRVIGEGSSSIFSTVSSCSIDSMAARRSWSSSWHRAQTFPHPSETCCSGGAMWWRASLR